MTLRWGGWPFGPEAHGFRYYVPAMGGEIGAFPAPSPPAEESGGVPLLPGGTSVFDDLPAKAIVIAPLAPAIGDGLVVVRHNANGGTGVFLVRGGEVVETHLMDADGRESGEAAARRIKAWKDATVSASRMGPALVAVVPPLIHGSPAFADLRLDWIKWRELLADVRAQAGTYVIEVITPSGRGVTCIRDGEYIATYTQAHPDPGDSSLLDELATTGTGIVRVLRDPDSAELQPVEPTEDAGARPTTEAASDESTPDAVDTPAYEAAGDQPRANDFTAPEASAQPQDDSNGHTELYGTPQEYLTTPHEYVAAPPLVDLDARAPDGSVMVSDVLPELKGLVRNRLHKSSMRLEILLEEAATWDRSVDSVVDDVRHASIRGVQQSTLDDIADQMRTVSGRRTDF